MPLASGTKSVGLTDDDSVGIDRIGHTGGAAGECAEILHHRAIPQESMRYKRWTVAEDRFANDIAAIVDGEAGGENGALQLAKIFYLVVGPSRGIDDAARHERIAGDFACGVDLESCAGRAT